MLVCLEEGLSEVRSEAPKVTYIDGAAVVQMLHPGAAKTIEEHALLIRFLFYNISGQFEHVSCLDLVWDSHVVDTLKCNSQGKTWERSMPTCCWIRTYIPGNWSDFCVLNSSVSSQRHSSTRSNWITKKLLITQMATWSFACHHNRKCNSLLRQSHDAAGSTCYST